MRTWPTSQLGAEGEAEADKESSHFSCLVAVGRVHPQTIPQSNREVKVKPTEFITRCAMDGKFTFVDQRYIILRIFYNFFFSCPNILFKVSYYAVTAKMTRDDESCKFYVAYRHPLLCTMESLHTPVTFADFYDIKKMKPR